MPTRTQAIKTADELLRASADLDPCELVQGELVMMTPAGSFHGRVESSIHFALFHWVREHELGMVFPGDTGFILERFPDTVRSPDVSFVQRSRIPPVPPQGFFPGSPDLAVEIRSPDDRSKEIESKIHNYLAAGSLVAWDVDPATKTVTVYRLEVEPRVFGEDDTLTEEALLPGFSLAVKDIFVW